MSIRLISLILFILASTTCETKKVKKIRVDDVIAEGEISKDTIYNGLINFYDTTTDHLVMTANYRAGILNGNRSDYYSNGKIKNHLNYENGKINGETEIYDSTGNISETQNIYFDLRVGPSIEYKNKRISQYYFYSLENKELLHIDYDSIQGKKVEQLNDTSFFFWHLNDYNTSESSLPKTELFLYLPNPPKLNFKYSLCIVDNKYDIKHTTKEFTSNKTWDLVNLDYSLLKTGEFFAIRLTVDNEFDNDDRIANMFKRL